VDINPMAVELCKVTLWLEALEPGKPLSFLDHHIRCGNSLLGTTPELIKGGIPEDAYTAIEGDDKEACAALKKKNKRENPKLGEWFVADEAVLRDKLYQAAAAIDEISDSQPADIRRKEAAFHIAQSNYDFQKAKDLADFWCAAFVIKKHFPATADQTSDLHPPISDASAAPAETQAVMFGGADEAPKTKAKKTKAPSRPDSEIPIGITTQHLRDFVAGGALPEGLLVEAKKLADQYQFFHWHLVFPEVFALGGFDLSLGNPPWEHTELKEKEWFAEYRPEIANARTGAERKKLIENLRLSEPQLYWRYVDDLRQHDGKSHFLGSSGKYPLCGRGRINLYAIFAETMRQSINPRGGVGCILPTGIATDDTTKFFFREVLQSQQLVSLYDFWNRLQIFREVQAKIKFCLLTLSNVPHEKFEVAAQLESLDQLRDPSKRYFLSAAQVRRINPNTWNCPTFTNQSDAELNALIYGRMPVLIEEGETDVNPWGISFKQGLFNMTSDSNLFHTREDLEGAGLKLSGNSFNGGGRELWPLYEAKLVHQYNHRAATFDGVPKEVRFRIHAWADDPKEENLNDPNFAIIPRFWVNKEDVTNTLHSLRPLLGFRNAISAVADSRSLVASLIPAVGVGNSMPIIEFLEADKPNHMVLAAFNSFVLDYVVRQKASGGNLNFYIVKQLPVPRPESYLSLAHWSSGVELKHWMYSRVLELTYTAWDLEAFAQDCGWSGPPFRWDEERRFLLRCELDAAFFHLYLGPETEWRQQPAALTKAFPTPRHAVDYILETFPIVKRRDEEEFDGDYRTKRVILEIYDALAAAMQTGQPYQTRLDPPPADPRCCHPEKIK